MPIDIRRYLGHYVSLKRGINRGATEQEKTFRGKIIGLSETKRYIVVKDIIDGRTGYYELDSLWLVDPTDQIILSNVLLLIRSKMQEAKGNVK